MSDIEKILEEFREVINKANDEVRKDNYEFWIMDFELRERTIKGNFEFLIFDFGCVKHYEEKEL